jgi:hypothetical protein
MRSLVLFFVCALSSPVLASGVDDALQAVRDAKSASDGDAACKGLSTKLKLSIEALEQAQKAPVKVNVQKAKGRVETAKDFVAGVCSDPVRAKVTEQLTSAVAALDKAAEPAKKEHQGAAFEAKCKTNDECASEHCFIDDPAGGYCSKVCEAPADCPAKWTCRRPGSAPEKICIK